METFLKNFFLCDQDMSDKQYFSLWCCSGVIVSNYILNKNVFKPTQISNLTWCALCDKRDKVWTQSTTNALLLIVQHNSNAIHVNWIWMTKLNRKMFINIKIRNNGFEKIIVITSTMKVIGFLGFGTCCHYGSCLQATSNGPSL